MADEQQIRDEQAREGAALDQVQSEATRVATDVADLHKKLDDALKNKTGVSQDIVDTAKALADKTQAQADALKGIDAPAPPAPPATGQERGQ